MCRQVGTGLGEQVGGSSARGFGHGFAPGSPPNSPLCDNGNLSLSAFTVRSCVLPRLVGVDRRLCSHSLQVHHGADRRPRQANHVEIGRLPWPTAVSPSARLVSHRPEVDGSSHGQPLWLVKGARQAPNASRYGRRCHNGSASLNEGPGGKLCKPTAAHSTRLQGLSRGLKPPESQ